MGPKFWAAAAGFPTLWFLRSTDNPTAGLAYLNLLSLMACAIVALKLIDISFRSSEIPALMLLPVSNALIFRWNVQKWFRGFAVPASLSIGVGFVIIGLYFRVSPARWLGLGAAAVASWAALIAMAIHGAARVPLVVFRWIIAGLGLMALTFAVVSNWAGPAAAEWFNQVAPALNLILPTGWAPSLANPVLQEGQAALAWLIIPVGILIGTVQFSLRLLQGRFDIQESPRPEASDLLPDDSPMPDAVDTDATGIITASRAQAQPARVEETEIGEIVRSRRFLALVPWSKAGPFEALLWRWLTPRERLLAEVSSPGGFRITAAWKWIVGATAVTGALASLAGRASSQIEGWILIIGGFIVFGTLFAQFFGRGGAFRRIASSGVIIPFYAVFPLGYGELSQFLLKYAAVQLPALIVFASTLGFGAALYLDKAWAPGLQMGFKAAILFFGGRFFATPLAFSANSNDSSFPRFRAPILLIVMALSFLGLCGGALFAPNPWIAWTLCPAAVGWAYLFFRMYGWIYNSNRFDLMRMPK